MADAPPTVDGRTFEQLVEEARKRIPLYTPDWTDFNPSDPGMALFELFAWLAETTIWQIDRAPERSFEQFIGLLGIRRQTSTAARADLTFAPRPQAAVPQVPAGTRVAATPSDGGEALLFETAAALELLPADLVAVAVEAAGVRSDVTPNNALLGSTYAPFGGRAEVGDALVLSFRDAKGLGFAVPSRLRLKAFMKPASLEFAPSPSADLRLEWAWCLVAAGGGEHWAPAELYEDSTAGLTRDGYLVLGLPPLAVPAAGEFRLRCRIAAGGYARGREPRIDGIRANTVPAVNLATVSEEGLGASTALANQYVFLKRPPVAAGTLILEVRPAEGPGGSFAGVEVWSEVPDFLAAGPRDPVFTLDPLTGRIDFGDGRRGAIPPGDAEIVARSYRWGGGKRGNVPAGTISQIVSHLPDAVAVDNEQPAGGGRDAETAAELRDRAPQVLRTRNRAVSADDYAALALEAGNVLEAATLPLRNPAYPGRAVPGCVSVVIVADGPLGDALAPVQPPPAPPEALIEQVAAYLEPRRIVTSELFVIAPGWRVVEARLRVIALRGAAEGQVREDCIRAVNAFLIPRLATPPAPLRFGHGFYPFEVLAAVSRAPGVRAVSELTLIVDGKPHTDMTRPVAVPEDGLLWAGGHSVVVTQEVIP